MIVHGSQLEKSMFVYLMIFLMKTIMEARSVRGSERVKAKLDDCIRAGNYYEAHQMYRTLYFRYLHQKKYQALLELLQSGAEELLGHDQQTSGADLAILYVQTLVSAGVNPEDGQFQILAALCARMQPDLAERETFVTDALRWSREDPLLHRLFAQVFWKEKNYLLARHHYLHSQDGQGCATMLIELHTLKGYPSEVDLFIAQAVLQYLCLRNKNTASAAFNIYTQQHPNIKTGPPYLLPLLNFIWFLLQAVDGGKLTVFTVLCEKYEPSIQRDPTYPEYLEKIAQIFFGGPPSRPRNSQGGILGNLFQSLFNDLDSESDDNQPSNVQMETEDVD